MVLARDAFDPDAVFLEDIVDDDVLPRLSLAVDGLTDTGQRHRRQFEMSDEEAANEPIPASTTMPETSYDPEQLEVYGWESTVWRKIRGYFGI